MQNNDIAPANVDMEFNCAANPSVMQNTINEAQTGAVQAPTGLAVTNTYGGVLAQPVGS